ncbi:MAG: hypothetical protein ACK5NY_04270 [Burkholderiaceae bacterium]
MRESPCSDATLLHEALLNEMCLDRRYVEVFRPHGNFLPYKVMRQIALKRRLGPALTPVLLLVAAIMPAVLLLSWLNALVRSIHRDVSACGCTAWIVPTLKTNTPLVSTALSEAGITVSPRILGDLAAQLPRLLGFWNVLATVPALFYLQWRFLVTPHGSRSALLLHARDAVVFLLLARFARLRPEDLFATECHYQRWSYVLSHRARHLVLVQHGLLDDLILFPCRGGEVNVIVVRDEDSAQVYKRYYGSIGELRVHAPKVPLHTMPCAAPAVFLASSFPTIDQEIAFARAWRERQSAPLIVKLHPAHLYDERGARLTMLADHQAKSDENPSCAVFISHSSSMELLYRTHGIRTVTLSQEPNTAAAVESVMRAVADFHHSVNNIPLG